MSSQPFQPTIGIISKEPQNQRYIEEIESRDGLAKVIHPDLPISSNDHLDSIDGIIVADHMSNPRLPIAQKPKLDKIMENAGRSECLRTSIANSRLGSGIVPS